MLMRRMHLLGVHDRQGGVTGVAFVILLSAGYF